MNHRRRDALESRETHRLDAVDVDAHVFGDGERGGEMDRPLPLLSRNRRGFERHTVGLERGVQAWPRPIVRRDDLAHAGELLVHRDHPLGLDPLHDHVVLTHGRLLHLAQARFDARESLGFLGQSLVRFGAP